MNKKEITEKNKKRTLRLGDVIRIRIAPYAGNIMILCTHEGETSWIDIMDTHLHFSTEHRFNSPDNWKYIGNLNDSPSLLEGKTDNRGELINISLLDINENR